MAALGKPVAAAASAYTPPKTATAAKAKFIFTRNLSVGITHPDVKELQKFLNANGSVVATTGSGSLGKETSYFGPATKAALIKFQKAKKIDPASGFFGPISRSVVNK
jgi:peptidoglycan hydrolase-like protein with peptidoglycan-binding domain